MKARQVTVLPQGLKEWRRVRGLSQESLAIESDCSPGLIALLETGRRQPSLGVALAIAKALRVPLRAFALVHVDTEGADLPDAIPEAV